MTTFLRCYLLALALLCCEALPVIRGPLRPLALTSCRHELEYRSSDLCCLNCPAGQHKKAPCSSDGGESVCAPCAEGSFTAHSNDLRQCLPCTKCRPDQEVVAACSPTQDTLCQCRKGTFCSHDDACEVCQRCTSCKDGTQMVKNCTAHSNRECSRSTSSTPFPEGPLVGIPVVTIRVTIAVVFVIFVIAAVLTLWFCKTKTGWSICVQISSQSLKDLTVGGSPMVPSAAPTEEEQSEFLPRPQTPCRKVSLTDDDTGVGSSHSGSSVFIPISPESSAHASPETSRTRPGTPYVRNDDQLFPLRGEDSLKRCFEYFHELDCKILKRFFRSLGISDNAITYELRREPADATYGLLLQWLEKTGKEASLNHLLQKLRDLDQNLTADEIIDRAVSDGHYERIPPNIAGEG